MADHGSKKQLLDKIEKEAHDYERDFHGCSRCVLKPLQDNLDLGDEASHGKGLSILVRNGLDE